MTPVCPNCGTKWSFANVMLIVPHSLKLKCNRCSTKIAVPLHIVTLGSMCASVVGLPLALGMIYVLFLTVEEEWSRAIAFDLVAVAFVVLTGWIHVAAVSRLVARRIEKEIDRKKPEK